MSIALKAPGWPAKALPEDQSLAPVPRLLLIDDDAGFTRIMEQAAKREQITMAVCHSIKEVGRFQASDFDLAIIDYDLGGFTGVQLAGFPGCLRDMPILLVSQYRELDASHWPDSIVNFLHKSTGPYGILRTAIEAHRTILGNALGKE